MKKKNRSKQVRIPGYIQILSLVSKARPELKASDIVEESEHDEAMFNKAEQKRLRKQQKAAACLRA